MKQTTPLASAEILRKAGDTQETQALEGLGMGYLGREAGRTPNLPTKIIPTKIR